MLIKIVKIKFVIPNTEIIKQTNKDSVVSTRTIDAKDKAAVIIKHPSVIIFVFVMVFKIILLILYRSSEQNMNVIEFVLSPSKEGLFSLTSIL